MKYQKVNILKTSKSEQVTEAEVAFETYLETSAYRKQISCVTRSLHTQLSRNMK